MKLEYLQTAQAGAGWFRGYYRKNPQLNLSKAVSALRVAELTVREYKIIGTAFSLLYTVADDRMLVIDLRDQRGFRSSEALRAFVAELRQRYGLEGN